MRRRTGRWPMLVAVLALLLLGAVPGSEGRGGPRLLRFDVEVLSSPAHLVSGDDARIRIGVPWTVPLRQVRVHLDGTDVSDRFHRVEGMRALEGVVDGLPLGDSLLKVSARGFGRFRPRTELTLTNHGDGPMFSGPRQDPFWCTVAGDLGGTGVGDGPRLTPSTDPDCAMDTLVSFVYRSATTGGWAPYDPATPPPADEIATTTTLDGLEVPLIVRWERGTINRFLYSIAMLSPGSQDEDAPDLSAWNRRLIYYFQGGVAIGHYQGDPSQRRMLYDWGLENGYAVVYSTATKTGTHYNLELGGETAIMLKDRFVSAYGDPLYTVGVGGSGGAIQQYVYGQNHPWLIDAAIPQYSYPDMITQTIHVGDCELLERWMDMEVLLEGDTFWADWTNRPLIEGMNAEPTASNPTGAATPWLPPGSSECINGWRGLSPLALNPHFGEAPGITPEEQASVEWTHHGDAVNVYGRAPDGFANRTWDNTGVQYGLRALVDGAIDVDEFLDLNANAGSWKQEPEMVQEGCPFLSFLCPDPADIASLPPVPDVWPNLIDPWSARNMALSPDGGVTPAPRAAADAAAVVAAYEHGLVFRGEIDIPIIDWRHYLEPWLDMHNSHQSFAARQRILNHDGDASNQVIWFTMGAADDDDLFDQTPDAFLVIDEWMRNLREEPWRGVAGNRPDAAVDSCFDVDGNLIEAGDDVWAGILDDDPDGTCTTTFPIHSTSRIEAGGPITGDVFVCHLQSVDDAIAAGLYGGVTFTPDQRAHLDAIFPTGVCDHTRGDALRPPDL